MKEKLTLLDVRAIVKELRSKLVGAVSNESTNWRLTVPVCRCRHARHQLVQPDKQGLPLQILR